MASPRPFIPLNAGPAVQQAMFSLAHRLSISVLWTKCNCIYVQDTFMSDDWWNFHCLVFDHQKDLSNIFIAFVNTHACKNHIFFRPVLWSNIVPSLYRSQSLFQLNYNTKHELSAWDEMNCIQLSNLALLNMNKNDIQVEISYKYKDKYK